MGGCGSIFDEPLDDEVPYRRNNFNDLHEDYSYIEEEEREEGDDKMAALDPEEAKKAWSDWQQNYSVDKDNLKLNDNLKFYKNEIRFKPGGEKIIDVLKNWKGDFKRLEYNHSYIQWLFPMPENSGMNYDAQALQFHEAQAIMLTPGTKTRVIGVFRMMMAFYGFDLKDKFTGELIRSEDWKARFDHLNGSIHNYRRLARIITSVGALGYPQFQASLVNILIDESYLHHTLPRLQGSIINHYVPAVLDDAAKDMLYGRCFNNGQPNVVSPTTTPTDELEAESGDVNTSAESDGNKVKEETMENNGERFKETQLATSDDGEVGDPTVETRDTTQVTPERELTEKHTKETTGETDDEDNKKDHEAGEKHTQDKVEDTRSGHPTEPQDPDEERERADIGTPEGELTGKRTKETTGETDDEDNKKKHEAGEKHTQDKVEDTRSGHPTEPQDPDEERERAVIGTPEGELTEKHTKETTGETDDQDNKKEHEAGEKHTQDKVEDTRSGHPTEPQDPDEERERADIGTPDGELTEKHTKETTGETGDEDHKKEHEAGEKHTQDKVEDTRSGHPTEPQDPDEERERAVIGTPEGELTEKHTKETTGETDDEDNKKEHKAGEKHTQDKVEDTRSGHPTEPQDPNEERERAVIGTPEGELTEKHTKETTGETDDEDNKKEHEAGEKHTQDKVEDTRSGHPTEPQDPDEERERAVIGTPEGELTVKHTKETTGETDDEDNKKEHEAGEKHTQDKVEDTRSGHPTEPQDPDEERERAVIGTPEGELTEKHTKETTGEKDDQDNKKEHEAGEKHTQDKVEDTRSGHPTKPQDPDEERERAVIGTPGGELTEKHTKETTGETDDEDNKKDHEAGEKHTKDKVEDTKSGHPTEPQDPVEERERADVGTPEGEVTEKHTKETTGEKDDEYNKKEHETDEKHTQDKVEETRSGHPTEPQDPDEERERAVIGTPEGELTEKHTKETTGETDDEDNKKEHEAGEKHTQDKVEDTRSGHPTEPQDPDEERERAVIGTPEGELTEKHTKETTGETDDEDNKKEHEAGEKHTQYKVEDTRSGHPTEPQDPDEERERADIGTPEGELTGKRTKETTGETDDEDNKKEHEAGEKHTQDKVEDTRSGQPTEPQDPDEERERAGIGTPEGELTEKHTKEKTGKTDDQDNKKEHEAGEKHTQDKVEDTKSGHPTEPQDPVEERERADVGTPEGEVTEKHTKETTGEKDDDDNKKEHEAGEKHTQDKVEDTRSGHPIEQQYPVEERERADIGTPEGELTEKHTKETTGETDDQDNKKEHETDEKHTQDKVEETRSGHPTEPHDPDKEREHAHIRTPEGELTEKHTKETTGETDDEDNKKEHEAGEKTHPR